jgi:hypothetical protein
MRHPSLRAACVALLWPAAVLAQTPAAAPPASEPAAPMVRGGEPNVTRTVIEDDGNRVEELRIRGQVRSIVVTTKGPLASTYEIGTGDPSREASSAADPRRGTIGQRMWRVFNF